MIASNASAKVQSYIDSVVAGDVLACKMIKNAIKRHLSDLSREGNPDFPYYFDWNYATAVLDFYQNVICHSIGEFAGLPFILEGWQATGLALMEGWRRSDDGSRRFRHVYWSTARKNGKSTFASGRVLFAACCDINPLTGKPESVADIVLSATKRDQADVVFNECKRMRAQSPSIESRSKHVNKQLLFAETDSLIRCVSSDNAFDGLNPSFVLVDEMHAFKEQRREFLATMATGGGSRVHPMHLTTTTAGSDRSYLWLEEYNYAKGILEGEIIDDKWLVWCFELDENDDPMDEDLWVKANPNLGVSVKQDYLRDNAKRAKMSPLWMNEFVRYHCNRQVSSTSSAFDLEAWDKCAGEMSDWSTADAVGGGLDVGTRDDFAAWAMVARFDTGESDDNDAPIYRYEIRTKTYCGNQGDRDLTEQPFATWVHLDLLNRTSFPVSDLCRDIIEAGFAYGVADIAYDPANAQQLAEQISQAGLTCASMTQNTSMFNEPISDFLQALGDGRIRHDGNPLLRWCAGNAVLLYDHQKRAMYSKRESKEKIDPIVAMTMAYRRAMCAPVRSRGSLFLA